MGDLRPVSSRQWRTILGRWEVDGYLSQMAALEGSYPNVTFVYMTGHLDGSGPAGTLHANNTRVRNYVKANNKVLFDFADIERWDDDGTYFPWVDDACMVYLTAMIRLFSSASFAEDSSGHYLAECMEFDFSPPVLESDTTQKRSVGVLVRFHFAAIAGEKLARFLNIVTRQPYQIVLILGFIQQSTRDGNGVQAAASPITRL